MSDAMQDKVLALAGVCQAASLVNEIARRGSCDEQKLETMLNTLLITHPNDVESIYGDRTQIATGMTQLIAQLDPQGGKKSNDVTRYSISLLALERKVHGTRGVFDKLEQRIEHIKRQVEHQAVTDDQVIANFASIYMDVISPTGPRIQVAGNPAYLKSKANQDKIRALLLAGLRSTILWRQIGGSRIQFIFSRRGMLTAAKQIRASH